MNEALEFLQEYKEKVNPELERYLQGKLADVRKMGKDVERTLEALIEISRGGKRFRGGLMSLGYKVAGGQDEEKILVASKFAEIFHLGLMVQDDVMDQDETRRGQPTVHMMFEPLHYGEAMATLVGDLTYAWGMEILLESGFEQSKVMGAVSEYQRYFERVVYGQMMDVAAANTGRDLGKEEILEVLRAKTAEYMGVLPFVVGARLAGVHDEQVLELYREYGLNLGWAFQIQDDVLSVYGQEEIGKPVGSDLREKKQTLLVMHIREHGTKEQLEELNLAWGKANLSMEDVERVRKVMKMAGSYDYVVGEGKKYVDQGKGLIGRLTEDSELQVIMKELIEYMIERVI